MMMRRSISVASRPPITIDAAIAIPRGAVTSPAP